MMFRPGQTLRLKLSHALTALVLLAVLATAALVHVSWMRTASPSIDAVIGALSTGASAYVPAGAKWFRAAKATKTNDPLSAISRAPLRREMVIAC